MAVSKFFLQVAYTQSSGWVLALRSNDSTNLDLNSGKLKEIGFKKSKRGNYVLVGMDVDENGIVLPDKLKELLSENAHASFQNAERWLPWVELKDQKIRFTKFKKSAESKPVVLVHAAENAAVEYGSILREVGFSISPNGSVYLATPEGSGFASHSAMVAELSLRAKALNIRLGGAENEALITLRSSSEVINEHLPLQYPTFFEIPSFAASPSATDKVAPKESAPQLVMNDFADIETSAIVASGNSGRTLFKSEWNANLGGIPPIVATLEEGKLLELAVYSSSPNLTEFNVLETYRFNRSGHLVSAVSDYPNIGQLELSREAATLQWEAMLGNIKQSIGRGRVITLGDGLISELLLTEYSGYKPPVVEFDIKDEFGELTRGLGLKSVESLVGDSEQITEQARAEAESISVNLFGEKVYRDHDGNKYIESNEGEKSYFNPDDKKATNIVRFLSMEPGIEVPATIIVATAVGFANNEQYSGIKDVIYGGGAVPDEVGKLVALGNEFAIANAMTMDIALPSDLGKNEVLENLYNIVIEHIKSAEIEHGSNWVLETYGKNILTNKVVDIPKPSASKPKQLDSKSLFERIKTQFEDEQAELEVSAQGSPSSPSVVINTFEDIVRKMVTSDILSDGILIDYPNLYQYFEQLESTGRFPLNKEDNDYFLTELSAMQPKIEGLGLFKASELKNKVNQNIKDADKAREIKKEVLIQQEPIEKSELDAGIEFIEKAASSEDLSLTWLDEAADKAEFDNLGKRITPAALAKLSHQNGERFIYAHVNNKGAVAILTPDLRFINKAGGILEDSDILLGHTDSPDAIRKSITWGSVWCTDKNKDKLSAFKHEHSNGEVIAWPLTISDYHIAREFFDMTKGADEWADSVEYVNPGKYDESAFSLSVKSVLGKYQYRCFSPYCRDLIEGEIKTLSSDMIAGVEEQIATSKKAAQEIVGKVVQSFEKSGFKAESDPDKWFSNPDLWNEYSFVSDQTGDSYLRAFIFTMDGFASGKPVEVTISRINDTGVSNDSVVISKFELDAPSDIFEKINSLSLAHSKEGSKPNGTYENPYEFELSYANFLELEEEVIKDVMAEVGGQPEGSRRFCVIKRSESNGTVVSIYSAVIADSEGNPVIVKKGDPDCTKRLTDQDVDDLYDGYQTQEDKVKAPEPKEITEAKATPTHSMPNGELENKIGDFVLKSISEKAFVVIGDTKPHKDKLNKNGARGLFKSNFNGWMFPKSRLEEIIVIVEAMNADTVKTFETKLEGDNNDGRNGKRDNNSLEDISSSENGTSNERGRGGKIESRGLSAGGIGNEDDGSADRRGEFGVGSRGEGARDVSDTAAGGVSAQRGALAETGSIINAKFIPAGPDWSDADNDDVFNRGALPSLEDASVIGKGYLNSQHLVNFAYQEKSNQIILVKTTSKGLVHVLGINIDGQLLIADKNGVRGKYVTSSIISQESVTVVPSRSGVVATPSAYIDDENIDYKIAKVIALEDIAFEPWSFDVESDLFSNNDHESLNYFASEKKSFREGISQVNELSAKSLLDDIEAGKTYYDHINENQNRDDVSLIESSPLFTYALAPNGFARHLANELDDEYKSVMADYIVESTGKPEQWLIERAIEFGADPENKNEQIIKAHHLDKKLFDYQNTEQSNNQPITQIGLRTGRDKYLVMDVNILTGESTLSKVEPLNPKAPELLFNHEDYILEGKIPSNLKETLFTEENLDRSPRVVQLYNKYQAEQKPLESNALDGVSFFPEKEESINAPEEIKVLDGTPVVLPLDITSSVPDITKEFSEGELEHGVLLLAGGNRPTGDKISELVAKSGGAATVLARIIGDRVNQPPESIKPQVDKFIESGESPLFINANKADWLIRELPTHLKTTMDRVWVKDAIAKTVELMEADYSHSVYIEAVESRLKDILEVANRRVAQGKTTENDIEQSRLLAEDINYIESIRGDLIARVEKLESLDKKDSNFIRLGDQLWTVVDRIVAKERVQEHASEKIAALDVSKLKVANILGSIIDELVAAGGQLKGIVNTAEASLENPVFKIKETYPLGLNYEKKFSKSFLESVNAIFEKSGFTRKDALNEGYVSLVLTDPDYDDGGGFATNELGFDTSGEIIYCTEFFMEGHRRTDGETFNIQFDQGVIESQGRRDPITSDRDFPGLALDNIGSYLSMGAYEIRVNDLEPKLYSGNPNDPLGDIPDEVPEEINPLTSWVENYDENAIAQKIAAHNLGDKTEILTAQIIKGGNQLHTLESASSNNLTLSVMNESGVRSEIKIITYEEAFGLNKSNGDKLRALIESAIEQKLAITPRPTSVLQSLPLTVLSREKAIGNESEDFSTESGAYESFVTGVKSNEVSEESHSQKVIVRPRRPVLLTSEQGVINIKQLEAILGASDAEIIRESFNDSISESGDISTERLIKSVAFNAKTSLDKKHDALVVNNLDNESNPVVVVPFTSDIIYKIPAISKVRETEKKSQEEIERIAKQIVHANDHRDLDTVVNHLMDLWAGSVESGVSTNKHLDAYLLAQAAMDFKESLATAGFIGSENINYLQAGILTLLKEGIHPKHIDSHARSFSFKGPAIAKAFNGLAEAGYITRSDSEIFSDDSIERKTILTDKGEGLIDLLPVESVFWHLETINKYNSTFVDEKNKESANRLVSEILSGQAINDPLGDFERDEVDRVNSLPPIQAIIETQLLGGTGVNKYENPEPKVDVTVSPDVIEDVLTNFDPDDIVELRDYVKNNNNAAIKLVQASSEFDLLEEPIAKTILQASKAYSALESGRYTLNDIVDLSIANWTLGQSGSLFKNDINESNIFIPSNEEAYKAIKEVIISHLATHEFLKEFDSSDKSINLGFGASYKLSTLNVLTTNSLHMVDSKEGQLLIVKSSNDKLKAAVFMDGRGRITATALKEYRESINEEKPLEINKGLNSALFGSFIAELKDLAGIKEALSLEMPINNEFSLTPDGVEESESSKTQQLSPRPQGSSQITNNVGDIEKGMSGGITQVALFNRNVVAIETLKDLEVSGREPTSGERTALAGYAGWGGLVAAFQKPNGKYVVGWEKRAVELESLLSPEEYESAKGSTTSSFYTNSDMIKPIYEGLKRMGVGSGQKWLEPSLGTGNFFGLMPPALERDSQRVGIELDSISSRIASKLYTNNSTKIIKETGYQKYKLNKNRFDVVVGNPPFGDIKLYDAINSDYNGMSIHNYFINKSLMGTRVGGVMAVVVSRYLMDKVAPSERMEMAKQADLVGAFRLPKTAFKSSNTEAVADILFFQRHNRYKDFLNNGDNLTTYEYPSWVETSSLDVFDHQENAMAKISVNNYFHENPANVIGTFSIEDGMIRRGLTVLPDQDNPWETSLIEAIKTLPENIYDNKPLVNLGMDEKTFNEYGEELIVGLDNLPSKVLNQAPEGLFYDSRYGVLRKEHDFDDQPSASIVSMKMLSNGKMADLKGKDLERLVNLVKLREILDELLLAEQQESAQAEKPEELRKELNKAYDSFVAKFGYVNSNANKGVFRQDPSWVRVSALEDYSPAISEVKARNTNSQPRKESANKMAIFSERLFIPGENTLKASTPAEALVLSLSTKGRVDLEFMSNLIGMDKENLINELEGEIFLNPEGLVWEHKDIYLSGNVKAKHRVAEREAFDNPALNINVDHLKRSFPKDIPAEDIIIGVGAPWLPKEIYVDFIRELAGQDLKVDVWYIKPKAEWIFRGSMNAVLTQNYSTDKNDVYRIMSRMASNNPLNCYITLESGKREIDAQETESVNQIAKVITRSWNEWILSDQVRLDKIAKIYNEKINVSMDRQIKAPDSFEITGKVPDSVIALRRHQKDYVWRSILKKDNAAIHDTGAGKTFAEVAAILTKRRLGLSRKPILAVPNHLTGSWTRAFYALYPHAKILSPSPSDFTKDNRQKLFAKIATGDWDCVIVAHSQLEKLPIDHDMAETFIKEQIDDIENSISETGKDDQISTKRLEALKSKLREKLEKTINSTTRDKGITWKMLNCDSLSVDESHNFKNLAYATSLSVAGLGNPSGSNKAFDYFVKSQSIRRAGGRVSDLTATPISNTIAEMYTFLRYKCPERLQEMGLSRFDAWVRQFAEVTNEYELDATGVKYRLNQRLSKFKNVPELMTLYREVSHIVTVDDIRADYEARGEAWIIPEMVGGKPQNIVVPRTSLMADYMYEIVQRAADVEEGNVEKTEDNKLKITTDARKAALDMRLIDDTYFDEEDTKVDYALVKVVEQYHKWEDQKGTQLIFCDLGVPKSAKGEEKIILLDLFEKSKSDDIAISDKAVKELEKYSPDEIDTIMSNNNFSVYDYIREQLVEKYGIPSHEIAFIHDAKTDEARMQLFADINKGRKRITIGSTRKMGEGMNAQERLVWQHELDCPWRPDQVQQRRGRIDRQGNKLFENNPDFKIGISRYATENTYDSRMWQTVETKARFIGQMRTGYVADRIVDDITPEAAGAAEMKAAASGNPDILREFVLRKEIKDHESQLREVARKSNLYSRDLKSYKQLAKQSKGKVAILQETIATLSTYPAKVSVKEDGKTKVVSALTFKSEKRGMLYTAKDTASAVLIDALEKLKSYNKAQEIEFDIGEVNGCLLGIDIKDYGTDIKNIILVLASKEGEVIKETYVNDVNSTGAQGMATILRNLISTDNLSKSATAAASRFDYYSKAVVDMESLGAPESPVELSAKTEKLIEEHAELLKKVLSGAASITATSNNIESALKAINEIKAENPDVDGKFIDGYYSALDFFKKKYSEVEQFENGKDIEEKFLPSLQDIEDRVERLEVMARLESRKTSARDIEHKETEIDNSIISDVKEKISNTVKDSGGLDFSGR